MGKLAEPAHVNIWFLVISGAVMVITLFFSKDAMKVAETQLNLSSQNDEEERFGSTMISRALVSLAINLNKGYKAVMPQKSKTNSTADSTLTRTETKQCRTTLYVPLSTFRLPPALYALAHR